MKKEELIKHFEEIEYVSVSQMGKKAFIDLIEQLDETQKVTIPQFVADYIEFQKEYNFHVYGAMRTIEDYQDKKVPEWFYEGNIEKFCLAWILGYEVEEEKRYYIRFKNVDENYNYLTCIKHLDAWALTEIKRDKKFRTEHTKKQLEEGGFGEVFNSPLFEVEEVEG